MTNSTRMFNETGNAEMSLTLAPDESFRIKEIRVHLNAAGGAGNFTVTVNAINGTAYDLNMITQDMTAVTDLVWQPDIPVQFESGDEINFAWENAGGKTYGLTVVYELL